MKGIFKTGCYMTLKNRLCLHTAFLSVLFLLLSEGIPAIASDQYMEVKELKRGIFLIAAPELPDPHFRHTVVLLVTYEKQGAVGLIINRPTDIPLGQALPNLKGIESLPSALFLGGPVGQDQIMALLRSRKPLDETQNVFDDVYVAGSLKPLAETLKNPNPEKNLRIYSGYAGWGPGQLDREVTHGDWIITTADSVTIFSENPTEMWLELFKRGEKIQVDAGEILSMLDYALPSERP